jgi:hypothetical protein
MQLRGNANCFTMGIKHAAAFVRVYIWFKHSSPFVMSTTKIIMSMICTPPMIVLISDACPGQSTSVNWSSSYGRCERWGGRGTCRIKEFNNSTMPNPCVVGYMM